jgi:hypothetical protein
MPGNREPDYSRVPSRGDAGRRAVPRARNRRRGPIRRAATGSTSRVDVPTVEIVVENLGLGGVHARQTNSTNATGSSCLIRASTSERCRLALRPRIRSIHLLGGRAPLPGGPPRHLAFSWIHANELGWGAKLLAGDGCHARAGGREEGGETVEGARVGRVPRAPQLYTCAHFRRRAARYRRPPRRRRRHDESSRPEEVQWPRGGLGLVTIDLVLPPAGRERGDRACVGHDGSGEEQRQKEAAQRGAPGPARDLP